MKVKLYFTLILCFILFLSSLSVHCIAWSNGGFSSNPQHPKYGTHDWIAEHALNWLPLEEKQFILDNLVWFLYGTELPDNPNPPYGIGDTYKHHVYYHMDGSLQDDASAVRAEEEYRIALAYAKAGDWVNASMRLGAMTHYISDVAVFGHVMGLNTDWGSERHHSDYENYVNERTDSYYDYFNEYLQFDGTLEEISAYNATLFLAYDTTFDVDGDLTCTWMDKNYNWSNPMFVSRVGESLNLAVNLIADVLHTFYLEYSSSTAKATVVFSAIGLNSDALDAILIVDGVGYTYEDLPLNITRTVGSTINFSWSNMVEAGYGKRYVWFSSSGLSTARSGIITVSVRGGSIVAFYKRQYLLQLQVNPPGAGILNPPEGNYWYDEGEAVSISAYPIQNYEFINWTGYGVESYSGPSNPTVVLVNGPIIEIANFNVPFNFSIDLTPSSYITTPGKTISANITVVLLSGLPRIVSLTTTDLPSGISISFDPNYGVPTFSSVMTIAIDASTPPGDYTIAITGTDGKVAKTITFTLTVVDFNRTWLLFGILALTALVLFTIAISTSRSKRRRSKRK